MPSADKRQRKKENARMAREAREAAAKRRKRLHSLRNGSIVAVIVVGGVVLINVLTGGSSKKAATTTTTALATTTTTRPPVYPVGCVKTVPPAPKKQSFASAPPMTIDATKTYVAHFTTTCGNFNITLDAKSAPKAVNSFVFLARKGFYDGLRFHRVAKDFVVQGGDPNGDGTGGPGYNLPAEPPKTPYRRGSVAMANSGSPNSTGSQFFLVLSDVGAKNLGGPPYLYSELGNITDGIGVVTKLGSLYNADQTTDPSTQRSSVPLYMFKVTITES